MKMIIGLGNPGKQYQGNRHNIGFQVVDLFAERHGLSFDVRKGKARAAVGGVRLPAPPVTEAQATVEDGPPPPPSVAHRVVLVKPQTFMNLSGQSVSTLARFYQVQPADMLVVYDELDLPLGRIRLRPDGGAGGHNGMKSIIRELGRNDFARLRIGIDRPPGRMDPAAYVLQDFSRGQQEVVVQVRLLAVDAIEHWLTYGIEATMNAFNSQVI